MRWYIHIGMPKNGSTFIQNSMFYLRTTLHEYGYEYPDLGKHHMVPLLNLANHSKIFKKNNFYKDIHRNSKCMNEIKKLIRKQIESIRDSGYNSIVLSSEHLSNLDISSVKHLKSELDLKNEDEFCIIVYVRDPIGYFTSWFSQYLRGGVVRDVHKMKARYEKRISPWIKVFGRNAVDIRTYDTYHFKGDGMLKDFFSAINLDVDLTYKEKINMPPIWGNPSFSAEAIECCKEFLKQISSEEVNTPQYAKLLKILTRYKGVKFELPPDIQRKILDNHKDEIQWLNQFLGHEAFTTEMLSIRSPNVDNFNYKSLVTHIIKELPSDIQRKILDNHKDEIQWISQFLGQDEFTTEMLSIRSPNVDNFNYKSLVIDILKELVTILKVKSRIELKQGEPETKTEFMLEMNKVREKYIVTK